MRSIILRKRALLLKLLFTALYLGIVILLYFLHIPCMFRHFLKIECPGCGLTRAYLALLHGDLSGAFSFHPLFWTVPILYLLILTDGKLFSRKWANTLLLGVILSGYLSLFILRLLSE